MSAVEMMFLDMGFSWTMSKALPYVLAILLGFVLAYFLRKVFAKNAALKWLFRVTVFIIPFAAYFIYSPIYEGDFKNDSRLVEMNEEFTELEGKKLVVISIPGCPYCYQAIERMRLVKDRLPDAEIEYVVCNTGVDSLLPKEALDWYREEGKGVIEVRQAENSTAMAELARGSDGIAAFPSFVLVDEDKPLKCWSNNSFGVMALDDVELVLD